MPAARSKSKKRLFFRIAVSVGLVLHLIAIGIAPNKDTYLGVRVAFWVEPYISFFELSSPWNFFAPDPGPPPVFVQWELLGEKGVSLGFGKWPDFPDPFFLRERQNRRIALARFMVFSDQRAELLMVPYLCRRHPEAHSVRLWRVMHSIPSLNDVASGRSHLGLSTDNEKRWVSHSLCERGAT